jgi:hypothetical protein
MIHPLFDPQAYNAYIPRSRGHFTAAKRVPEPAVEITQDVRHRLPRQSTLAEKTDGPIKEVHAVHDSSSQDQLFLATEVRAQAEAEVAHPALGSSSLFS